MNSERHIGSESQQQIVFDQLRNAYMKGNISIGVNTVRYNRPGSEFYRGWESSVPTLALFTLVVYCFTQGWLIGITTFFGSALVFVTLVRKFVMSRVRTRVIDYALTNLLNWKELWNDGGLSLRKGDRHAISPREDSWIDFILDD